MDALALVVSATILILLASVQVVAQVKHRRAAARWRKRESVFQQAGLPLDATLLGGRPAGVSQIAVVPVLVGLLVGGAVALGTYLAYRYQYSQTSLLLSGVVLVVAGLRLRRSRPTLEDDETDRD